MIISRSVGEIESYGFTTHLPEARCHMGPTVSGDLVIDQRGSISLETDRVTSVNSIKLRA